nr:hypothetical protein F19C7.8 - Caenorhabditis elegans [Caenorhabditis elegans]
MHKTAIQVLAVRKLLAMLSARRSLRMCRSVGRRRAPKLTQQMKSLSLDCQDMPPRINQNTRSPLRSKLAPRDYRKPGINGSSDFSDVERSCSPIVKSRRSSSSALHAGGYIVIHEYSPSNGSSLVLGEKVRVVDNGDPDWLHGFRLNDRTEHMISFPATCVAQMMAGEQAMRIQQNVFVAEQKLRMYRDQKGISFEFLDFFFEISILFVLKISEILFLLGNSDFSKNFQILL